jgi:hypothetical protein
MPTPEIAVTRFDYLSSLIGGASLLLAIVSILIAILALPIFFILRSHAARVAREAALETLAKVADNAEKNAIARMEALLPSLVADYMELAKRGSVSGEEANLIAASQEAEQDVPDSNNPPRTKRRSSRPKTPGE